MCITLKPFLIPILLAVIGSTGCKKLVQVDTPDDRTTTGIVFSNDSMASAAITGLYSSIMNQTKYFLNGGMSLFPGLSADELTRTSSRPIEDQFTNNSLISTNTLVGNSIWKAAYSHLYQCNVSLEGLEHSKGISVALKGRLMGEVKFVRALCYHYLVNLFGAVPLVTTSDADKNALLSRSPEIEIYNQIVEDLEEALMALIDTIENTRPNRMACHALLSRVYLYQKNWIEAERHATAVLNSGKFQIVTNLDHVFKSVSTETIFQWAPVLPNVNAAEGNIFVPSNGNVLPTYVLIKPLLDAFENGDLRRNHWVKAVQVNGSRYTYPYKYKIGSSTGNPTEYNIVLRVAELYLVRAEARAQLDNTIDAVADINVIRTRAGLPSLLPVITQNEAMAAIERERRIELFAEWGHRWFDLKRLGKADAVLSVAKINNWQKTDQLYPIPFSEIESDPNLVQNEGYE